MNERNAREARRRAEAEREQAELAGRAAEEEERRRRSSDRRAAAAGGAEVQRNSGDSGRGGGHRRSQTNPAVPGAQQYQQSPTSRDAEGFAYDTAGRRISGGRQDIGSGPIQEALRASAPNPNVPTSRYRAATVSNDQPRTAMPTQPAPTSSRRTSQLPQSGLRQSSAPASTAPPVKEVEEASGRGNASSFPHAFERWEQLSSHWEGLTSYWLHKLEANTAELDRNVPSAAALSRQINDLSAAGANLFHAVVELQRLRASSERKFQRWFFETRNEQEHAQENQARLETAVQNERAARTDAFARANQAEQDKRNADKMVVEMRRELLISKDEARRAWEELGRKEHEERELTTRLREGAPTTIGGVQVVPTQSIGGVSRHDSDRRPTTSEGPQYQGQRQGPIQEEYLEERPSPTDTDPFVESGRAREAMHPEHAGVQSQAAGVYQPYPLAVTPATSGSTAPTVIPPQPRQRAVSPLRTAPTTATPSPRDVSGSMVQPGSHAAQHQPQIPTEAQPELFYRHPPAQTFLHSRESSTSTTHPTQEVPPSAPPPPVPGQQGLREQGSYVSSHASDDTEYEIDEHGNLRLDAHGRPVVIHSGRSAPAPETGLPPSVTIRSRPAQGSSSTAPESVGGGISEISDEFSAADPADVAREREHAAHYGLSAPSPPLEAPSLPPTSAQAIAERVYAEPVDYEGGGYEGWTSRHHHPTRLSDVLEEDERSRTTGE